MRQRRGSTAQIREAAKGESSEQAQPGAAGPQNPLPDEAWLRQAGAEWIKVIGEWYLVSGVSMRPSMPPHVSHILKTVFVTIAVLLTPSLLAASSNTGSCLQRTVWFTVIRADGRMVANVDASDLTGRYHGKPVRIVSVRQHPVAPRVLILLDTSGSMEPVRKFASSVAEEVVARLPQSTKVAALTFAEETEGTSIFTADHEALRNMLSGLEAQKDKKMTALIDSMQRAVDAFGAAQEGDTIYVISDGKDNASRLRWHKLQEELIEHGTRVFAMLVRWRGPIATVEDTDQHLSEIVNSTGGYGLILPLDRGRYEEADYNKPLSDSSGKLTALGRQLAFQVQAISYASQIVIQLPEPEGKKNRWQLRFANPKLTKNLTLVYQRILPPCTSPSATTGYSK